MPKLAEPIKLIFDEDYAPTELITRTGVGLVLSRILGEHRARELAEDARNPKPRRKANGTPKKPARAKSTPKKATPGDGTPEKATPNDSPAEKAAPAKSTPKKPTPAKSTPKKPTPGDGTPKKPARAKSTPKKAAPVVAPDSTPPGELATPATAEPAPVGYREEILAKRTQRRAEARAHRYKKAPTE